MYFSSNDNVYGLMRAKGVVYFKIAIILILIKSLHMIVCNVEYRIQYSKRVKLFKWVELVCITDISAGDA